MKKSFSLVEILIVTAIIALLTAIALPHFLKVKLKVELTQEGKTEKQIAIIMTSAESIKEYQNNKRNFITPTKINIPKKENYQFERELKW